MTANADRETAARSAPSLRLVVGAGIGALVLVALLVAGGFHARRMHQLAHDTTFANLVAAAIRVRSGIAGYLDATMSALHTTARMARREMRNDPAGAHVLAAQLLGIQPALREVVLLDDRGKLVARASRLHIEPDVQLQASLADARRATGDNAPYVGSLRFSPATREPLLTLAVPVIGSGDGADGLLAAEVGLKALWPIIARHRVATEGRVYVVDAAGRLVADVDRNRVLRGETIPRDLNRKLVPDPGRSVGTGWHTANHFQMVYAVAPTSLPGWRVVAEMSNREIDRLVWNEALRFAWLLGAASLGAALLGALLAHRVVAPLEELVEHADHFARGDLRRTVVPRGSREVRTLGAAFADMAHRLQEYVGKLNDELCQRRQAESELRASQANLTEAQRLAGLGSWEWRVGDDETTERWSDQMYAIFGVEPGTFVPTFDNIGALAHPEDRALLPFRRRDRPWDTTYRIHRPDGEVRKLHSVGRVERDAAGNHLRSFGTVHDITDQQRAEDERERLYQALAQTRKMEAVGQLTAGIAHEFNNILAVILGYSGMLLGAGLAEGDAKRLREVVRAGERARDLIAKLLSFSRTGDGPEAPASCVAPDAVRDATSLLGSVLPSTIELHGEGEVEPFLVAMDALPMQQLVMNLCINARDAMDGQGAIFLALESPRQQRGVCVSCGRAFDEPLAVLEVADTGPGMDPVVLARVFEPFFTTKEVGKGTGLGLSVVHGLVHDRGGHITIDERPGGGTRVRVLLPRADAPPAAAPVAPTPPASAPYPAQVLLVDDEQALLDYLDELLSGNDYQVTACGDARQAARLIENPGQHFDLLLTDQTMPELSGLDLARIARRARPSMTIALCTGYSERITPDTLSSQGIDALFEKPVEASVLLGRLHALLSARRASADPDSAG